MCGELVFAPVELIASQISDGSVVHINKLITGVFLNLLSVGDFIVRQYFK
jgi:hypothetical protein